MEYKGTIRFCAYFSNTRNHEFGVIIWKNVSCMIYTQTQVGHISGEFIYNK